MGLLPATPLASPVGIKCRQSHELLYNLHRGRAGALRSIEERALVGSGLDEIVIMMRMGGMADGPPLPGNGSTTDDDGKQRGGLDFPLRPPKPTLKSINRNTKQARSSNVSNGDAGTEGASGGGPQSDGAGGARRAATGWCRFAKVCVYVEGWIDQFDPSHCHGWCPLGLHSSQAAAEAAMGAMGT